jgi:5-methylcytosine-specific restriction endonuclease McrA
MKQCTKCGIAKLLSDFYKDARRKDGVRSSCKLCSAEIERRYKKENRARYRIYERRYSEKNREVILERAREKYKNIAERVRERVKNWYAGDPERNRIKIENRRARKNGGRITVNEWKSVLEKYNHRCLYPGCERTDVTMDHVIPLSLGGAHTIENVQPLCSYHNCSKSKKHVDYRVSA